MRLAVGSGDGKLSILRFERAIQSRYQIARQERAIGRGTQYKFHIWPVDRGPVECRENAGEWSGKIRDAIRDDWQSERRKARGIAIGIQNEAVALRRKAR